MKSSLDISNFLEEISAVAATAAKSFQLYPTRCYPIDSSPPGFPVPGILQARILDVTQWPSGPGGIWEGSQRDRSVTARQAAGPEAKGEVSA